MAEISLPDFSLLWASAGDILQPSDSKIQQGWAPEIPPRQWFNWLDNRQDQAIAHVAQHGIPVWSSELEYQANKSYVQGPTNGTVYRCVQTHTNQNPETDSSNTYWIFAFASAGDFYTKAEVDNTFLTKSGNLSDLTNAATARTNLGVYATTNTYTQAEVNAKTTVASAAQAQALTSNTVLLSPLQLANAFIGANRFVTPTSGYQKLPGGLIIQWGYITNGAGTSGTITYPITFPTTCVAVVGSSTTSNTFALSNYQSGTTTFDFTKTSTAGVSWFAVGY